MTSRGTPNWTSSIGGIPYPTVARTRAEYSCRFGSRQLRTSRTIRPWTRRCPSWGHRKGRRHATLMVHAQAITTLLDLTGSIRRPPGEGRPPRLVHLCCDLARPTLADMRPCLPRACGFLLAKASTVGLGFALRAGASALGCCVTSPPRCPHRLSSGHHGTSVLKNVSVPFSIDSSASRRLSGAMRSRCSRHSAWSSFP